METNDGFIVLHDPRKNRGTAFTEEERGLLGLKGLLPEAVESIDLQVERVHEQIGKLEKPINKYVYLLQLMETNETLFYKVLMDDPVSYMPLVYTPTVGEACQTFGHIFRRPRGIYLSIKEKDNIRAILQNWQEKDVRFTVVTDGERILGLGDLGICGMGIPIGKLSLYTACAGVPPEYTLPIMLDAGTNNQEFLNDSLYPGLRQERARGEEYDAFIAAFVEAITEVFPKICIQWEDFAGINALRILNTFRDKVCTFNDDIQGTAAVATGGLLAASRYSGKPLTHQKFLFLGAGAAAIGIADMLVQRLQKEALAAEVAYERIYMFDNKGLLVTSRSDLTAYNQKFAHDQEPSDSFVDTIKNIRPTAIIGVSTIAGAFTREVIEAMSAINERPVIFPYSNPTSHSECTADEAYNWSKGKAIFASGSPFPPVIYNGKTFIPGQGNNVYIFPAIGLAVFATEARRLTNEMFLTASEALAKQVKAEDFEQGLIYPPLSNIFEVSVNIAVEVATRIFDSDLAGIDRPLDIEALVKSKIYRAKYEQ
ncbi:NAD-dependent malic enzyme [Mucilaginibacter sabulilitoris]|uniref:NAD-dependent malic enzyme n=1 Tax=Mucilaginibacter sabulilitoris TaxID=1173583 RepID=A0ABZ0TF13_9SPHI|nr:NAD-dependent malic enzyme [Mucilaginibacter sabulilitoris]WPU91588.1 NAD-dependent malic enzyme [Mucilaginibacter sabulilitoris]